MATSASDGALRPLQRAMKFANRAIQLDTGNMHREAYMEYLKCVSFISQSLLEEADKKGGCDMLSADSQKMLKLAEQCLERARSTAGKGKADVDVLSLAPRISEVPDTPESPSCEVSSATTIVSSIPCSTFSHPLGHRRTSSEDMQKLCPFPPPEIFEKLRTAEAHSSKKELTPMEEASIQNQKLRAAYEARLARLNPNQAAQKTSLTLSLQRQMMENLVIAKAREETLQRKTEERRLRLQEESNRRFSQSTDMTPGQEEQRMLYTAILEYEQDHEWLKLCKMKMKGNPSDSHLISSVMFQILSTHDHPISKMIRRLQCQIYTQLYEVIRKDPTQPLSPTCFHSQSLPVERLPLPTSGTRKLKSSQSLQSLPLASRPAIQHSLSTEGGLKGFDTDGESGHWNIEKESSFEDLEMLLSPTGLYGAKVVKRLTATEQLNDIIKEIHNARDLLLSVSILALDLKPSSSDKDECLDCLDESFFPPLWPALLALYRHVYSSREDTLIHTMDLYKTAPPSVVGVPPKLYPHNVKEPYKAAVEELKLLPLQRSPQRKMECIVRSLRVICECAGEYCDKPGTSAIGADDLLPILAFVVLRSHLSELLYECAALEEFLHEGYLIGEEGYCLTSVQSALVYLETMSLFPAPTY
ncbi:VPS9 domain-containing protein 1 [Bombina bombina]|uniref:VPS9 domain-containing protein 1 n=1 Tax=Bombina bombina TaxID=8345 RepID=UPI00235ADB0E|nr:VPS9 domain-containing protein 1 [Bombina bombina]